MAETKFIGLGWSFVFGFCPEWIGEAGDADVLIVSLMLTRCFTIP